MKMPDVKNRISELGKASEKAKKEGPYRRSLSIPGDVDYEGKGAAGIIPLSSAKFNETRAERKAASDHLQNMRDSETEDLIKREQMGKTENKRKGGAVKMAKGGSVSSASKRADGCAVKGKTKGRMV
jgi:hypothetical protein